MEDKWEQLEFDYSEDKYRKLVKHDSDKES